MPFLQIVLILAAMAMICSAQNRDAEFAKLADRYFEEVAFRYDPAQATQAGFHQHDRELPTYSRAELQAGATALKQFEREVGGFDPKGLSAGTAADREMLLGQIRGQLLTPESIHVMEEVDDVFFGRDERDLSDHEP
jgi:uncharacterized protein (DUF885 family)